LFHSITLATAYARFIVAAARVQSDTIRFSALSLCNFSDQPLAGHSISVEIAFAEKRGAPPTILKSLFSPLDPPSSILDLQSSTCSLP
jgi:hypothetical protein